MPHATDMPDKALITKLAHLGWDVDGDRLVTTRSFPKEVAHHMNIEFQAIGHRVGLKSEKFNEQCKLSMEKNKARRFFDEQGVTVMLSNPDATLAPRQRQRR